MPPFLQMKYFLIFVFMATALGSSSAQTKLPILGEVGTNWPGIQCQIYTIKRIADNRLLVGIRLKATAEAAAGTLIGYPPVIPPGTKSEDLVYYQTIPFSMASSVMVEDKTQDKYRALPPIPAPPGDSYFPDSISGHIRPGQNMILSIQFALPPPPLAPAPGQAPLKQTVSFSLTNTKDLIKNIPIPPPSPLSK